MKRRKRNRFMAVILSFVMIMTGTNVSYGGEFIAEIAESDLFEDGEEFFEDGEPVEADKAKASFGIGFPNMSQNGYDIIKPDEGKDEVQEEDGDISVDDTPEEDEDILENLPENIPGELVWGDYTYKVENGKAMIIKYQGTEENLIIPNRIKGYEVTEIGYRAFYGCDNIRNVKLPESLTTLRTEVFNSPNITKISIPPSVTIMSYDSYWSSSVFKYCKNLETVIFESGRKEIPEHALCECTSVKHIEIPEGVREINWNAFERTAIEEIKLPSTIEKVFPYVFYECGELKTIDLPEGIKEIGNKAFYGCDKLTNIEFPNSLTTLGTSVLSSPYITKISIPPSVTTMSYDSYWSSSVFKYCKNLETVIFESGRKEIPEHALCECTSVKHIEIPEGVKEINWNAFERTAIEEIKLPSTIEKVFPYAFYECGELKTIDLPEGIKEIGNKAFYGCDKLTNIEFPNSLTTLGTSVLSSPYITKISIPPNVTEMNYDSYWSSSVFKYCENLETVVFANGRKEIPRMALYNCKNLKVCQIPKSVTSIGDSAFANCPSLTIYGVQGSYAQTYAKNNNIPFKAMEAEEDDLSTIKKAITIEKGKSETAGDIIIRKKGVLTVNGNLNAQKITVEAGGKLIVDFEGKLLCNTIIIQGGTVITKGGILETSGLIKTDYLNTKDYGIISVKDNAQIVVYTEMNMATESKKSSFTGGELFINGSLSLSGNKKNFVTESESTFKIIFCNKNENTLSSEWKLYNIGMVCVSNQSAYDALKLDVKNYNSAVIFTNLKKYDWDKRWTYNIAGKVLKISSSDWSILIESLYSDLVKNSAYTVTNSKLTNAECRFVESVAKVWVNTIQMPLSKGLNEYSSKNKEMTFVVGKHQCTLSCRMDGYGVYAINAAVYLSVDGSPKQVIGMVAAGSYQNFKAQAAIYITEGYLKQYYEYATEKVVKKVTSKNNTAKVAGEFLEKIIKKTCFKSLNTSEPEEVKKIKKAFDIKKYFGAAL